MAKIIILKVTYSMICIVMIVVVVMVVVVAVVVVAVAVEDGIPSTSTKLIFI